MTSSLMARLDEIAGELEKVDPRLALALDQVSDRISKTEQREDKVQLEEDLKKLEEQKKEIIMEINSIIKNIHNDYEKFGLALVGFFSPTMFHGIYGPGESTGVLPLFKIEERNKFDKEKFLSSNKDRSGVIMNIDQDDRSDYFHGGKLKKLGLSIERGQIYDKNEYINFKNGQIDHQIEKIKNRLKNLESKEFSQRRLDEMFEDEFPSKEEFQEYKDHLKNHGIDYNKKRIEKDVETLKKFTDKSTGMVKWERFLSFITPKEKNLMPKSIYSATARLDEIAGELEAVDPRLALVLDRVSDKLEAKASAMIITGT